MTAAAALQTIVTLVLGAVWPSLACAGLSRAAGGFWWSGLVDGGSSRSRIMCARDIAGIDREPARRSFTTAATRNEASRFFARPAMRSGEIPGSARDVRAQLETFPTDIEGPIDDGGDQAENLNDLRALAISMSAFAIKSIRRAIYARLKYVADWYLKFHQDREPARDTCSDHRAVPDLENVQPCGTADCEPGEHRTYAGGT